MTASGTHVLIINSGSSSVKYELFAMELERSLVEGEVERIGTGEASLWQEVRGEESPRSERPVNAPDHAAALREVFAELASAGLLTSMCDLAAIGHRVVHGGASFVEPTIVDEDVIARIERVGVLAPLHTAANLAGVRAAREHCPDVPSVAVFDTAFHRTLPARAREYALPRDLARDHGIRRYGFHGTSHAYVAREAAHFLGRPLEELDLITLHLGNGASACAIHRGVSIDTSMGMTPLEGLVMGTRCGDVDPAVPLLIRELTGLPREDVHRILNHESGLLGLCGVSDMREVHERAEAGDHDAHLAIDMFCYRAKKYVGAYLAALGRADALVFTAGIGEHDAEVRGRICEGLEGLGIELDEALNAADAGGPRDVALGHSPVRVLVIPTDEESEIARQAYAAVRGGGDR